MWGQDQQVLSPKLSGLSVAPQAEDNVSYVPPGYNRSILERRPELGESAVEIWENTAQTNTPK